MPVILATQQVEIRKITVRSLPQANGSQDPTSKNKTKQNKITTTTKTNHQPEGW
jgi:hypothetical protein